MPQRIPYSGIIAGLTSDVFGIRKLLPGLSLFSTTALGLSSTAQDQPTNVTLRPEPLDRDRRAPKWSKSLKPSPLPYINVSPFQIWQPSPSTYL
jgi:hypothetical protein